MAVVTAVLCVAQAAWAEADRPAGSHYFAIDASVLTSAIQELSTQGDVQIITSLNTGQMKGGAVHGVMSAEDALSLLLKGLPVKAEYVAGGYILKQRPAAPELASTSAPEQVVVAGYRGSLQRAIDLKRDAVISQDSIVADDIAAFPDINLAESMQRISGIAITRDSGEGRQITLRSLGPDFTRTQINGMEVLSNTASGMDNRGLVSRTRSFDFSLFASELFDRVTVEKSYSAGQDEGGIAGTVQLRTPKPFDYPGFKAAFSAKGMSNSEVSTPTPHLAALISDHWGAFGALVAVAYSTADSSEYGYRNWGWHQVVVGVANIGPGVGAADAQRLQSTAGKPFLPMAETYSTWLDRRTRLGINTSLQYRPSAGVEICFDGLYAHLTNNRHDYALAAAGSNGLVGDVTGTQRLDSIKIVGSSVVAAGFSHVDLRSESNVMRDTTNFYQAVLSATATVDDRLTMRALLGISRSGYTLPVLDKVFLETQGREFGFDYSHVDQPENTYGSDLTDRSQWNLMRLDTQEGSITSRYNNAKFDVTWRPSQATSLVAGVEYKRFRNDGWSRTNKVFHNDPVDTAIPDTDKFVVADNTIAPYVVGNVDRIYANIGQIRDLTAAYGVPGSDYRISEETQAIYLQFNFDGTLFGLDTGANVGARYFTTGLRSAGTLNTGSSLAPISVGYRYDDFLPAANVVVRIAESVLARFSANRNISRPALADLAAAGTLTTAPFGGTISTGNPNLRPFIADSVETSLEYYDEGSSYVSLGVFYKNMQDFITTTTTVMPYSQTGYPLSFLLPRQDPNISYNYTAPVNGKGADFVGIEAAAQKDFKFLPPPLDHLGMIANLTYADGNGQVIFSGRSVSLPLVNLSKLSFNATLYYETERWSVRVSQAYRSKYRAGTGSNGNIGDYFTATNNLDFALHYRITDRLKATIEGINLTDQPIIQYADAAAKRIEVVTRSGSTLTFGAAYEF